MARTVFISPNWPLISRLERDYVIKPVIRTIDRAIQAEVNILTFANVYDKRNYEVGCFSVSKKYFAVFELKALAEGRYMLEVKIISPPVEVVGRDVCAMVRLWFLREKDSFKELFNDFKKELSELPRRRGRLKKIPHLVHLTRGEFLYLYPYYARRYTYIEGVSEWLLRWLTIL